MEKRYRRLLALYPKDHRRQHAEEMVGVLLAADGDAQVRAPKPVAWALRFGRHTADSADLIGGALRIRGRMVLNHIRRARWFSRTVRDQRWSDALAVVSVVAPLLLLVAALTEFRIPQAMAGSLTGHPHWRPTATLSLADLPLAAGAPAVTVLAFLRLRWLAGLGALAAAIGQIAAGVVPAFAGYANPAVAFTVLLSCTAAAALLLSPGPDRGLALLTRSRTARGGAGARIRGRMVLNRVRRARWFSRTVRDQRWSDALAVVSVVAPLLLLVAALTEFRIPQALAGTITGHSHWRPTAALSLADLPLAAGAPAVTLLAFLRLRWLAGLGALAAAIGQIAAGAVPAFAGYANPAVAFTVLLSCTAAAALLLSPGPDRGLALLTRSGTALVGAGALILGGFSAGGTVWLSYPSSDISGFGGEVAGLPADLLIAAVLVTVAVACLRAPVSRRVLALLAIPVIPYAILWQEKLAGDLLGQPGGTAALIPSSIPLLYLPPLILACLIVAGTWLARRRATGRDGQAGSAPSAGPRGAVSA